MFSDNMVVQQNKRICVWGRGIEGDRVTVSLAGQSAAGEVVDGRWEVELDPVPAGGPHLLTIAGSDRTLEVENVLAGEVWVLAGQSNMSWPLAITTEAALEIPRSDYPEMRVFSGWHPAADTPQFDTAGGAWKAVSPELRGNHSAVGYYFGKALFERLGVPIGLIDTSTPATEIDTWLSQDMVDRMYPTAREERSGRFTTTRMDPSVFFNAKVAPVMPFGIAGIAWYQGDASHPRVGHAYRTLIPALIEDWRTGFRQGELPFLVVQIPSYQGCSPEMRESQLLTYLGVNNVGLAVTLDTSDPTDLHPQHKRPVGERLALLARAIGYGEPIVSMGPVFRAMEVRRDKAYLDFDHTGTGLVLEGGGKGFEIRGRESSYVPAEAVKTPDGRICVWNSEVPAPVAVRYAWAPVPEYSLSNNEGLLASPFRTLEEE